MRRLLPTMLSCIWLQLTIVQTGLGLLTVSTTIARPLRAQSLLDQRITLAVEDQKIRSVLNTISKQIGIQFTFSPSLLRVDRKVTLRVEQISVAAVLERLFAPVAVRSEVVNGRIVIGEQTTGLAVPPPLSPVSEPDKAAPALADVVVTGTVTDELGVRLPGVNVAVKGTARGTSTDRDGAFSLSVPDSDTRLIFSFIGYETQEVSIGNRQRLTVSLKIMAGNLNEVVVVGYGTVKKSDLTGAVVSINATELKKTQLTSLDQGLQGRAPGVQVTQSNGQPGGGISVRIRGGNSITGNNEPLYVIDGFPVFSDPTQTAGVSLGAASNPLASINPNDIASIEVLKDASATAIYGARGANGVVIITTRRGQSGKAKVDYEGYMGNQQVIRMLPLLNARQYAELINDARQNTNIAPFFSQRALDSLSAGGGGTDWQREIFRTAPMQSHQVTVSGGNEQTQYAVSGNYLTQEGILINSGFKRGGIRLNLDAKASKILKVGTSLLFSQTANRIVPTDAVGIGNPGVIWSAHLFSPLVPVYNPDGTFAYRNIDPALGNPVAYAQRIDNKSRLTRFLGSIYAELAIADGLTFRVNAGQDYSNSKESLYVPSDIYIGEGNKGQGRIGVVQLQSLLLENTLTYQKIFDKRHAVSLLTGYTIQSNRQELVRAASQGYPTDQLGYDDLSFGATFLAPASAVNSSKLVSYIGRGNYGYKGRYLFTATVRIDGSTRFGAGNKYGVFPSGSAAWRIIEEPFMKAFERSISDLKLRVSYGVTGNQEIGQYRSLPLLSNYATVFGNNLAIGIAPSNIPNPELKWETTGQFDIGTDVALWSNRITLTADYYQKNTRDLLLNITLPLTSGYGSTLKNIGQVSNKGWELGLTTVNVDNKVRWTTSLNVSANRNKVRSLGDINQFLSGTGLITLNNYSIVRVGESVGSFFGRVNDGIFQNQAEIDASAQRTAKPGERRYKDLNNDGIINDNDRTVIGDAQPKLFGGITNTVSWKGLELTLFVNGVSGNRILNVNRIRLEQLGGGAGGGAFPGTSNNSAIVLDRWTPTNPSQVVPQATTANPGDILSSYQVEDGSFLRVKNIVLAYSLPTTLAQRLRLRTFRVYVSGQNLLTFTNYTGYDPEVSRFGSGAVNAGIDFGGYPIAKLYTIGLNVGL